ncbi:hypothetical protein [Streptomyces sp. NBC_00996]|uniref:hypothetical protein n=1 Tax=Streptomyces sp. NBC_00996 TaxID=2903710 RepID=UPI00386BC670
MGECDQDELPSAVRLSDAGARRRAEFAAGRLAAWRALEAATDQGQWLRHTATGSPAWSPGVRGSLSHSDAMADRGPSCPSRERRTSRTRSTRAPTWVRTPCTSRSRCRPCSPERASRPPRSTRQPQPWSPTSSAQPPARPPA